VQSEHGLLRPLRRQRRERVDALLKVRRAARAHASQLPADGPQQLDEFRFADNSSGAQRGRDVQKVPQVPKTPKLPALVVWH